jgi:hypothetical protein
LVEAAMMPFAPLLAALDEIQDPRRPQGRRYTLAHLLLFSVLAVLAGATSYQSIITFMSVHRESLNDGRAGRQDPAEQFRPPARSDRRTCLECVCQ